MTSRLSIVIVSYNSIGDLDACLGSITSPPPQVPYEIVLVDNASRDGTPEHVRRRWPGVRVIDAGANLGFAKANNLGIRHTSAELVLLLNPDTIVRAGALDALVAVLDTNPRVAVVGPRLVDGGGRAELSFGAMMSPLAELRQKILVVGHDRQVPFISQLVERQTRRTHAVDWVSGACLLVRRTVVEDVGLFDEGLLLYTEDVDLCAAVRAQGHRVLFTADTEIVHLRGRSTRSNPKAAEAAYRRSHIAFYQKHHPAWASLLKMYLKLRGRLPDMSISP